VLKHYLSKGYKLLYHRYKHFLGEVDLVLQHPQGHLTLVEVKSLSEHACPEFRVSHGQKQRLRRVLQSFISEFGETEFHLALVRYKKGRGQYLQDSSILCFESFLAD